MRLALVNRFYRIALYAYPPAFRATYGTEMERVFAEGLRDARAAGAGSTFHYYLKTELDLFASAGKERLTAVDRISAVLALAAIGCGCFATYIDFHATEVQATLLVILLSNFALGCVAPHGAWWRALLVAMWLPAINVIVYPCRNAEPVGHPYLSRLLLLLPALGASLIGAYAGVLARYICQGIMRTSRNHN